VPTVIVHHDVKDTRHRLASPERTELAGPPGIAGHRLFADPQNPSRWRCSWASATGAP